MLQNKKKRTNHKYSYKRNKQIAKIYRVYILMRIRANEKNSMASKLNSCLTKNLSSFYLKSTCIRRTKALYIGWDLLERKEKMHLFRNEKEMIHRIIMRSMENMRH